MTLAARLWADNSDVVAEVLAHPFVRGIGDGSLDRRKFAGYLAQDAFYLESFARAYAFGLARSTDTETLLTFAELLNGVREELKLHSSYAAAWDIDMAGVQPADATLTYCEFLLATAATADVAVICAAMTPCMRLYAHIGTALNPDTAGPYADWVRTYADPEFDEVAAVLENLLDRLGEDSPAIRSAYRRAMRLELAFFDSAWRA
ncbi:TenA family protein [Mycolicibacterium phlei]|jgi:thiaminase/transcriptional activator TenA|uniref:TenA family protein n=1 Tax=Mycolicibacterium phlei TaxID=1771 RepID=UPI00025AF32F|nr:TenA family protein [Mycolicibacterium phlei]EID09260.1 putative transcription activator [Mycolicibacterium phlei RIVM601174]